MPLEVQLDVVELYRVLHCIIDSYPCYSFLDVLQPGAHQRTGHGKQIDKLVPSSEYMEDRILEVVYICWYYVD